MKRWRNLLLPLLLCYSLQLNAQWESPISHYWEIAGYYNPSFIGATDKISTTALYKYQWAGIENAPQRIIFTAEMPFKYLNNHHAASIVANTENIGVLRNSFVAGQYSFKQQIGSGFINAGIQLGIHNLNYYAESIKYPTNSEQGNRKIIDVNTTSGNLADVGAGISWIGSRFQAGLSASHINQPSFYITQTSNNNYITSNNLNSYIDSDSVKTHIPRTYIFFAKYNIQLFYSLEIEPIVLLQTNSNKTYSQATLKLEYNNKYSAGFTWISADGHTLFASTSVERFRLGYAYTKHNNLGREIIGSHELFIKYELPLDYLKPKSQSHKSIRLL